ncbi:MAG TPA: GTPase Era [Pseudomonadales bacterium]|jgi:GTP-binding protein Era|nr:GTPase Era [Pseudomonadales bacterium]HNI36773.1 GTPase Era [Pseudomonadales bacterium]HNN85974.1 GTPase Era [Pseudomonadales bacterium]
MSNDYSLQISEKRCGMVAVVGRPNVGKSTLLNHLVGQKLCITSRKPQTTRHLILGIKSTENCQIIFVDTPGMHKGGKHAMNQRMNKSAAAVLHDVDIVLWVVDRSVWTEEDEQVLQRLTATECPVILAINKTDKVEEKASLLPVISRYVELRSFLAVIPVSALQGTGLDVLEDVIAKHLPVSDFIYPEDQLTDKSERFFAAEIVREKIIRQLGEELPYQTAVEIEQFVDDAGLLRIAALIIVEKEGQKKIVIGDGGERLKKIGQQARLDMEKMFGAKVMLKLWVKVRRGWADNERALNSLGIE